MNQIEIRLECLKIAAEFLPNTKEVKEVISLASQLQEFVCKNEPNKP